MLRCAFGKGENELLRRYGVTSIPGAERSAMRMSSDVSSDRVGVVEDFADDPCQLLAVMGDGLGFEVRFLRHFIIPSFPFPSQFLFLWARRAWTSRKSRWIASRRCSAPSR